MLELNTNIGRFKDVNSLILEMKHLNVDTVEVQIRYCLKTIQDKKVMTLKELEDLKQWDNPLSWQIEFLNKK